MSKHLEKSKLVNKLSKDDPECMYVNSMLEISIELLKNICKGGDNFSKIHGVVPKCKLPYGYDFGKNKTTNTKSSNYDYKDNKNNINQKSSISLKIDNNKSSVDKKKSTAIDIVSQDLKLSSEDEDYSDNLKDNGKIFETLNKCSSKIPKVESLNIFRKHYANNRSEENVVEKNQNNKKEPPDDASCTGDTEPFEDSNESVKHNPQDVMKLIELLTSSKPQVNVSAFEPVYNEIIRKRKALKVAKDDYVQPAKKIKRLFGNVENDVMRISMVVTSQTQCGKDIAGESDSAKTRQLIQESSKTISSTRPNYVAQESSKTISSTRPNYVAQESLPFSKSDISIKKEAKIIEKNNSQSKQQLFCNPTVTDDPTGTKKPQAAAKQIIPQTTNYSNFHNNRNIAVIAGINKNPSNTNPCNTTTPNVQIEKLAPAKSFNQRIINANVNEEDEQKVVEGLMAIEKLRTNVKNEYMNRMRNLDTDSWLRDADGHKVIADGIKGQLDYVNQIIITAKKYLIYNYSLDVKEQNKKCHETYLHNADLMQNIGLNLNQIYKSYMVKITDQNSPIYWNLDLVRWFSHSMFTKLKAILQYRAYRNVASYCKELHNVLINHGVIDNDGRTSALLNESNQNISPFSVVSSYSPGRNSNRNSSPRVTTPINNRSTTNNNNSLVNGSLTLTTEMRSQLQKYIDKTKIVNNSYADWTMAEVQTAKFCKRSQKHEEAWKEMEWKIIEKTGGITINGIDESMPFVIRYLDGFLSYISDFQKYLNSPLDPT